MNIHVTLTICEAPWYHNIHTKFLISGRPHDSVIGFHGIADVLCESMDSLHLDRGSSDTWIFGNSTNIFGAV